MKALFLVISILVLSCGESSSRIAQLENRLDSLQQKLSETYKPGFGEFMSNIQLHHAKLWFAGQNQNWKLADFEIHEISESLEDLQTFQSARKETQLAIMLKPALDSVSAAIQSKDISQFRLAYDHLTKTCNDCHRATEFEFNIVKTPDVPPISNQAFK